MKTDTPLDYIFKLFEEFDQRFTANVLDFLKSYSFPTQDVPFLMSNMITFIKVSCYSLFLILPLAFLKIIFRENYYLSLLFVITLIAFAASTFAIFLGFFQLLFI